MKRSEMIQLMLETSAEFYGEDILADFKDFERRFVEAMLKTVETHGMLPPFNHDMYYNTWRDGGNGRQWEPEEKDELAEYIGPEIEYIKPF